MYLSIQWGRGCIPAYNGAGGVYPSMQWMGGASQHAIGQGLYPGGVCQGGGCLSRGVYPEDGVSAK